MENKFSVIKDNLKIADNASKLSDTISLGQLEELAHLFSGETLSFNLVTDIFEMVFNTSLLSAEFLTFCKLLYKNNSLEIEDLPLKDDLEMTVSFLDNDYSKQALSNFQNKLKLSGEAEMDFNSVCEAVYSGRSKYAILPLFNSRDGLIISLYKLLQKYELKIIASTKVLMNDGNTETDFCLVSRTLSVNSSSKTLRMMLSVTHSYDNTVPHFLSAVSSQNIKLISINTLPLEYTDERCESVITCDISACDADAIRCFLHSSLPEASIVGIYFYC